MERQEIRFRLAELDSEDWLDDEDPLTDHEKAILDAPSPPTQKRTVVVHGKKLKAESDTALVISR